MVTVLKGLCKERGLSLSKLARMADMNQADVSKIANGRNRPYPGQAQRLAEAIGWEGATMELFEDSEKEVNA